MQGLGAQGLSVRAPFPVYPSKVWFLLVMDMFSAWTASGNKEVWEATACCMKSYFLYSYIGPQLSLWTPQSNAHFLAFHMCQWS